MRRDAFSPRSTFPAEDRGARRSSVTVQEPRRSKSRARSASFDDRETEMEPSQLLRSPERLRPWPNSSVVWKDVGVRAERGASNGEVVRAEADPGRRGEEGAVRYWFACWWVGDISPMSPD